MATSFGLFVVAGLAVWRVTHLVSAERGPGDILGKLRGAAGTGAVGRALACFYCASVWVAAPIALGAGATWGERLLLWPALSAVAILLERRPWAAVPPAPYVEDPAPSIDAGHGEADVQLRE